MLIVLLTTFCVAVASALCPLVNLETYLALAGALALKLGVWPLSATAAAGQSAGKLCWYAVGRSSMQWAFIQRRMQTPRWQRQYATMKAQADKRSWAGMSLLFVSASVGLPPLAIMSAISGQLRFNRWWFCVTTFAGRTLRFAAVLGGVSWLAQLSQ